MSEKPKDQCSPPHTHPLTRHESFKKHILHDSSAKRSSHHRVVVFALDSSPASEYAFKWASKEFLHPEDLIVLLNCRPGFPQEEQPKKGVDLYAEMEDRCRSDSHALLEFYAAKIKDKYLLRAIALKGDVREEILKEIQEMNADVVICGSSKNKGERVGSVSSFLTAHCNCNVIVVKKREKALEESEQKKELDRNN